MAVLSARGCVARDETLAGLTAAELAPAGTLGRWICVAGCLQVNVYVDTGGAGGVTLQLEGSFDGETNHGTVNAGLALDDPSSNLMCCALQTGILVPYVAVDVTAIAGGPLVNVYVYGAPGP